MADSIFTKIIKGEIPSHKVYEDDFAVAFMDIHPIQPGMVLVVSKRQTEDFLQLSEAEFSGLMVAAQKIAIKMKTLFPAKQRIGVMIEGLEVDHTHVKLFPIDSGSDFRAMPTTTEPDHAALGEMAKQLAF